MKRFFKLSALAAALSLLLSACGERRYQKEIFAMDTVMDLTVYAKSEDVINGAAQLIFELDSELDNNDAGSALSRLNASGGGEMTRSICDIINTAADIYSKTDGSFDITVAPVMRAWGFYEKDFRVPADSELSAALSKTGFDKLKINGRNIELCGTELDLGGIAKGYAADKTIEYFKENNVGSALISLGGNVYALGKNPNGRPWTVAVADPNDPENILGELEAADISVVTSGIYMRNFELDGKFYHHITDPETGKNPENDLASVTVAGPCSAVCDALSTAFFVMGEEKASEYLKKYGGAEALFVYKDGSISASGGLADTFKTERTMKIIH